MRASLSLAIAVFVLVAVFVVPSGVVSAHHSNAEYGDKLVTMEGTVVEFRWRNPHVTVVWDSKDESGKVVQWKGELASITTVMASGMTRHSLKAGDPIKISVYPSKLGTPSSVIQFIQRPDGTVVLGWSNQAGGNPEGRANRNRNRTAAEEPKPQQ